MFLDGIWLKRAWGGEVCNGAVLVVIGVNSDGDREILGVCEGSREDAESWRTFLRHLKSRGLQGVRLVVSDKSLGLIECLGEVFPESRWQRCIVHFYRNVLSMIPKGKAKSVVLMLKAVHAQEDSKAAEEKLNAIAEKLEEMKLKEAARLVRNGGPETLPYYNFPTEHWRNIRTNNPLERMNREIRCRTRVVGSFPDGHSALMLVCARLRYMATSKWGTERYLRMAATAEE